MQDIFSIYNVKKFGVSKTTVATIGKSYNITLTRKKTNKLITSPELKKKVDQKVLFNSPSNLKCCVDIIVNQTGMTFINTILNSFKNQTITLTIEPKS